MDTERCKALLCTIEEGSITAAAAQLGYTPSGISRMMAALEQETGFALLLRGRNGVQPTRECLSLLPTIRELVHWSECYKQLADEILGLENGIVVVGTSYSIYYQWLAKLIAAFRRWHPRIEVRLLQANSSALCTAMAEHRVDLCIISQREGNYHWYPLLDDPLMAWVPSGHRLADLTALPLSVLEIEPFIDTYAGQETDNARMFARCGIKPNVQFTTSDSSATYAMVEAGLGISLDNSLIARNWSGQVKIMPLDPPQTVNIGLATPDALDLSPAAQKFVKYTLENVTELI